MSCSLSSSVSRVTLTYGTEVTANGNLYGSDSIFEVNVKTLDSHIYIFQVEKNRPVPLFKEKIAGTIGVPVEQHRLIFRGNVLKESRCLSEYHVEDGDTLRLVLARQLVQPQTASGTTSVEANANTNGQGNVQVLLLRVIGWSSFTQRSSWNIVDAFLNSIGFGSQIPMGATNTSSSSVPPMLLIGLSSC
ncbi:hypothetical protein MKW98_030305 [Papaver atlanticum]|uniref:Ubiquitin-like domain-containing protein n=1 Tax=Papaver atlanticum TaxID=357466 RepID=A0AAD4TID8_9MAGN|nr:hypothetical protein MKW98_030305 [Papaver atlanticum]